MKKIRAFGKSDLRQAGLHTPSPPIPGEGKAGLQGSAMAETPWRATLPSSGQRWLQHWGVLLILTVYLALAFYRITQQSLWVDEIYTLHAVTSLENAWQKKQGPLYFVVLYGWKYLWRNGEFSEFALRSLSVLFGSVAVCLYYAVNLTLFSKRVAVIATVLFATSPFLIWYSQEGRYITLSLLTALLMLYWFRRLCSREHFGEWFAYGLTVIFALLSFIYNFWLLLAQGLFLLWSTPHRGLLRKWIICQMLVLTLFGGWVGQTQLRRIKTPEPVQQQTSIKQGRLAAGQQREFSPFIVPYTFYAFSAGFSLGPSVRDLHIDRSLTALISYTPMLVILTALFGSLFFLGMKTIWHLRDAGRLLTLWVGVPILGAMGISTFTNIAYNVRYVSVVLPAYVCILAAGIVHFRRNVVQTAFLVAVLLVYSLSLANHYFAPQYAKEDARAAARYLELAEQPGDAIFVIGTLLPLKYYYKGTLSMASVGRPQSNPTLVEHLRESLQRHDRLWLVELRPWGKDPKRRVKTALDQAYALVEHKQLPNIDIYLYRLE